MTSLSRERIEAAKAREDAAARTDLPEMANALLRVLNMHRPFQYGGEKPTCVWCGSLVTWPCATVRAITGEDSNR